MSSLVGDPRRQASARWLLAAFYLLLTVGGITMVFPFWMMLTGSVSDGFDFRERRLIPAYLTDRDELFRKFLIRRYSGTEILPAVYGVDGGFQLRESTSVIKAPTSAPRPQFLLDWEEFLRSRIDPSQVAIANPDEATVAYQNFLKAEFSDSESPDGLSPVERLNARYGLMFEAFSFVELPPFRQANTASQNNPVREDFARFLGTLPASMLLPLEGRFLESEIALGRREAGDADNAPEAAWEAFVQSKYRDRVARHAAWGNEPAERVGGLPYRQVDAAIFLGNEASLRWNFASENYRRVWELLSERSDAIRNTVILIVLTLITTLLVNPLAAYSLSRFPGRGGRLSLVFILMTIAFPAEVGMIPGFLLLRDLNLLNSYAALVLPAAVSGFSIFLLKGFFDGLPEELYESANMDGASDWTTFWTIAVPLSAPVLAVTALGTFTATYGGYMWALLVCQAPEMWTMMVWLFQFQLQYSDQPWLAMAAFAIASVPTLIVFVLCQRVILRGIVIPVEK